MVSQVRLSACLGLEEIAIFSGKSFQEMMCMLLNLNFEFQRGNHLYTCIRGCKGYLQCEPSKFEVLVEYCHMRFHWRGMPDEKATLDRVHA